MPSIRFCETVTSVIDPTELLANTTRPPPKGVFPPLRSPCTRLLVMLLLDTVTVVSPSAQLLALNRLVAWT